jgi:hypothetical protein
MEDKIFATELGDVVASMLEETKCDVCGAMLQFVQAKQAGKSLWLIYANCPNGCFGDEFNVFRLKRVTQ